MGEANCSRAMRLRTILLIVSMGLAMSIAGCLPVLAATRQVVLLYDERVELPGLSLLDAEIVRVLRSNSTEPVEIYREAMDLSRFASSSYKTLLRDFLRAKYADRKIDVVVAVMAPALDFLLAYGDLIFPGAPIVFCGVDRRQLGTRSLPPNVYGVLIKREFAPTLELALRLHPATNNVVVVSGTSEFDTMLLAEAQKEFRSYENRISFTYLSKLSLQQLLATLSRLPSRDVVLILTMFKDGAGQPLIPHEVVERVSSASSVPVYGFLDQYLGRGIVGGACIASRRMATRLPGWFCESWRACSPPSTFPRSLATGSFSTGARCTVGASASAVCLPGAKSSSGHQPHGNGTRGKSRSLAQLFWSRPR